MTERGTLAVCTCPKGAASFSVIGFAEQYLRAQEELNDVLGLYHCLCELCCPAGPFIHVTIHVKPTISLGFRSVQVFERVFQI